ncbi:MAG: HAMP domain-containing sensor histidine kinase [Prevotellaceae bacterium]|nr:HAMP domain-containing sensor histidine kinase [Prevotellaceae bacterium]
MSIFLKRLYTTLLALLLIVPAVRGGDVAFDNDSSVNDSGTMILTTYSQTYRWSQRVIKHIGIHLASNNRMMPSIMHMPMVGIKTREQIDSLALELRRKLKTVAPKRIILVGSTSYAFCEDINAVFPNIPMLLIGGQDFGGTKDQIMPRRALVREQCMTADVLRKKYNASVQTMPVYLKEEVRMIRSMMPDLKNIYFVGGQDVFSRTREAELRKYLNEEHKDLEYRYLWSERISLNALMEKLMKLDPRTDAVIYSSWQDLNMYQDAPLLMTNSLFVIGVSSAPTFLIRDNGWVEGLRDVIGGCFLDENHFYDYLDTVLDQFLNSDSARDIPSYKAGAPIIKFNYNKLVSMGIDPNRCPEETQFLNKPENTWEKYRYEIMTGGIIVMMALLMLVLYAYYSSLKVQEEQKKSLDTYRELQKERQKNDEFLANIPIGYMRARMICDDRGAIMDLSLMNANNGFKEFWAKCDDVEQKCLSDIMPATMPSLLNKLNECRGKGEKVLRGRLYVPDGDKYLYMVFLFFEDGTLGALLRDDTENIRKTMELREAKKEVEFSNRMKDEFIKNINHEVRTPLNSVCGFSELLIDPQLGPTYTDEEKMQMYQAISSGAAQITLLVNNMLEYSEMLNGTLGMEVTDASANRLARYWLGQTARLVPNGVEVKFETTVPDEYRIKSCMPRLQRVIINVLSNAFKFTEHGSVTLRFETDAENGLCRYVCTDTGCGVPEDKVDFIFDSYAQVNPFVPGMGMGLYLSRRVMEMMGGRIYVDTTYKEGARFVLELKA